MYGVNSSVNIPNAYKTYGKNAQAQSPQEQNKTAASTKAMRADEILFTDVYQADKASVDALGLSDDAKNLLLELKEKYKGYDFMVGDYQSGEEASRILNHGKGTVMNVLITPSLLEEMAADESVRAKYENIIASASDQFTAVKSKLNEGGKYYLGSVGLTVNEDGSYEYYAFLKNGLTAEDGQDFLKSDSAEGLANMLNKTEEKDKTSETQKTDSEDDDPNKLSDKARDVLNELMDKYRGYDFIVGNWKTDEEASRVLSYGRGRDGNVLISPELLERMAADESVKAQYTAIIDEAAKGVGKVREELTEKADSAVDRIGASVANDGTVTYFAKLVQGLTANDGSSFLRASGVTELTEMLNAYAENNKISQTEKPEETIDPNKLSEGARNVLYELMEKYKGYDFIVGSWETDEEASRVLSYGKGKDGNVLISPELLERMAADESVKAEYMGIIENSANSLDKVKNDLSEDGRSIVEKLGLTVGADGTVSYFAKLIDGVTTDDGGSYIKCSIIEDFTKSLETLAKTRQKLLEGRDETEPIRLDTPEEKEEKVEKSVMPPKSFEKYEKEENPYSTEEDYGNLPPESFKKYQEVESAPEKEAAGEAMNFTV